MSTTFTPGTKFDFCEFDARATNSEGGPLEFHDHVTGETYMANGLAFPIRGGWTYVRPLGRGWHLMVGQTPGGFLTGESKTVYCKITTRTLNSKAERIA